VSIDTPPLRIQGTRVCIRWWESRDDREQRKWPRYTDPCHALWNIPRTSAFYTSVFGEPGQWPTSRRVWAIEDAWGRLIGRISLREIDIRTRRARLGISLGAPYVGQGMGTEALALFLEYYFTDYGFDIMALDVAAFNQRAVNCYERLGFRIIGDEWRKTHADSCLRMLDDSADQELQRYFRRERLYTWVLFYEMELRRVAWLQSAPRSPYPRSGLPD
jgi:RimJ/RimL family protein N-acetyltransferase